MKSLRRSNLLGWLIASVLVMNATGVTLKECANAYAFVHVVSNPEVLGDSRNFKLYQITNDPAEGTVSTQVSIVYAFYNCIDVYTQQSRDMGKDDPWALANRISVFGGPGMLDVPYFEGVNGGTRISTFSSTNSAMFYRIPTRTNPSIKNLSHKTTVGRRLF